ncbi:MAG TPA: aminomethyltransferase family protein [Anaerolineales bacterium]|nr:aminomethyltransferase family protein [Anaerolineales bacterium]
MTRGTAFHSRTAQLCEPQNWRRWAGYFVVGSYELAHDREYFAIRNSAALIDVSPLHKYLLRGPDAVRLLDRVVTRDVAKCAVGQVLYTPWCDEDGKVIDDGTITRLDEQTFRLTAAEPNLRWLNDNTYGLKNVSIEDVSDTVAALALQGPLARSILSRVSNVNLENLKYFRAMSGEVDGVKVTVSRTGYTGDLGYEIWIDAAEAVTVWDALIAAGEPYGITPTGILGLDVARIEAGLIMLDVDYTSAKHAITEAQKSSPFELGLGWAVSFDKGDYVGRRALMAEKQRGPAWQFVGLDVEWESLEKVFGEAGLPVQIPLAAWRSDVPIYSGGRQIGYATSGVWSPLLKKYIVLAHVESAQAKPGNQVFMEVTVDHRRRLARAFVTTLPFFDPERKRK